MLKTEHRPAPMPPRPTAGPTPGQRRPLPDGAARWSKTWLDSRGLPQHTSFEVPVDAFDRRTEHARMVCRGLIEVDGAKQQCDQTAWMLPGAAPRFCPDHGCALEAEEKQKQGGFPARQVWDVLDERIRVAAVVAVTGVTGAVLDGVALPWTGVAAEVAALPAAVVSSWWLTRWWLTRQAVKREKLDPADEVAGKRERRKIAKRARLAGYLTATGAGWVGLVDVFGAFTPDAGQPAWAAVVDGWPWLFALAGAGIVGSHPYRRWVDSRRAAKPEAVAEAPAVEDVADVNVDAVVDADHWQGTVAVPGGLPGTFVDVGTWRADPGGRRMVIRNRGRGGALTDEKLRQALPLMAGAFDVSRTAFGWIEEFDGSPNAVELLVQPNSPLNDVVPGGPIDVVDLKKAVAFMGRRIDGTPLVTRLFTPGWGSPSRAIFGTKGSGKTELIRRMLLVQLLARFSAPTGPRRLIAPFLHDPKRGADYGAFRRQVHGFSLDSTTLHMIVDAFAREMDRRYDALASTVWTDDKGRLREGEKPFDPSIMGPILSLWLDEFHVDAKDTALMAKLDPFARKMRAAGIEINIATHAATIGDTGSQGFRDMLAGGEAWLLRTTMGLNAALATGGTLTGDPRLLPRVPGMVLQASGEDVTMQARIAYDGGDSVYDMLYDDDNQSRIHPVEWLPETLEAFGPEFVQWMRDSQARPIGSVAVSAPTSYQSAEQPESDGTGDDRNAFQVLVAILAAADRPLRRGDVMANDRWTWKTRQLGNCLREGQDMAPPVIRKVDGSNGAYELTEFGGTYAELQRGRAESAQVEAAAESEADDL